MTIKWDDLLLERLKDKKEVLAYLNAALEDTKDGSEESQKVLFTVLRHIAKAQGDFSELSSKTGLGRESLYKTLSIKGNPRFNTVTKLISAMGFELKAVPAKK